MKRVSMMEHFSIISDPRVARTQKHNLLDIIIIAVCGVISSCQTWVDISEFGRSKESWFRQFLKLPNGIPSHDTFGRVFSLINPFEFQKAFYDWVQSTVEITEGEVISIDGKYISSSYGSTTKNNNSIMGVVSAWASRAGVALAQKRIDFDKKNEKQVFKELIEFLTLKGAIVTIDANGCHAEIANKIFDKGGNYFLSLKRNQRALFSQANSLLMNPSSNTSFYESTFSKDHGRIEKRSSYAINVSESFLIDLKKKTHQKDQIMWSGLKSFCKVVSQRTLKGETTEETRYYLSSLPADAQKMYELSRSHWEIENKLHWVLDVAFDEDHCRVRTGYAGENFAVLRKLALNLLREEKTSKRSINGKRLKTGWDNSYMEKVIQCIRPELFVNSI